MKKTKQKIIYALMKLSTDIVFLNPLTGQKQTEKIQGIEGYIPCFKTMKQAVKESNGQFEIIKIKLLDNE